MQLDKCWKSGPQQQWSVRWDCSTTGDTATCWNAEPFHFLPSSSCTWVPSLSLRAQLEQEQEHWDPQLQNDWHGQATDTKMKVLQIHAKQYIKAVSLWTLWVSEKYIISEASGTYCTEGHLRTGLSKTDNTNSPTQTIFVSSKLHANTWGNAISSGHKYTDHVGTKAESASYSRNNPEPYFSSCGMLL